jgi:hypothetical protein
MEWRNTCNLWKKTIWVRWRSFMHIVFLGKLSNLWKE